MSELLASYYEDGRKDYSQSSNLLADLNTLFSDTRSTQNPILGNSVDSRNFEEYNRVRNTRQEKPTLLPQSFTTFFALDRATSIALNGDSAGVASHLSKYLDDPNYQQEIKSQFMFDPRISPKKWVEEKISNTINKLFSVRHQVEANMSKEELIAYDKDLATQFEQESFVQRLVHELEDEYNQLAVLRQLSSTKVEDQYEAHLDVQRMPNT